MNVAEKLKKIADERGIKYSAIASNTGIPVDLVSKSFLGKRKLIADEMLAICGYMNVDMIDLVDKKK